MRQKPTPKRYKTWWYSLFRGLTENDWEAAYDISNA